MNKLIKPDNTSTTYNDIYKYRKAYDRDASANKAEGGSAAWRHACEGQGGAAMRPRNILRTLRACKLIIADLHFNVERQESLQTIACVYFHVAKYCGLFHSAARFLDSCFCQIAPAASCSVSRSAGGKAAKGTLN